MCSGVSVCVKSIYIKPYLLHPPLRALQRVVVLLGDVGGAAQALLQALRARRQVGVAPARQPRRLAHGAVRARLHVGQPRGQRRAVLVQD